VPRIRYHSALYAPMPPFPARSRCAE